MNNLSDELKEFLDGVLDEASEMGIGQTVVVWFEKNLSIHAIRAYMDTHVGCASVAPVYLDRYCVAFAEGSYTRVQLAHNGSERLQGDKTLFYKGK